MTPKLDIPLDKIQENRRQKAQYRSVLADISLIDRVTKCGCTVRRSQGVGVAMDLSQPANNRVSGFRGLYSCGSVWACPRCAAIIGQRRSEDVNEVLLAHKEAGGHGFMLTLTMAHSREHKLDSLWNTMSEAWKKFTNNRSWTGLRANGGMTGYCRATEVTCSENNGWHVHFHTLILFDSVDEAFFGLVNSQKLFQAWSSAVSGLGRGFYASKRAQDARPINLHSLDSDRNDIHDYLFKQTSTWSIADEATRWSSKKGRGDSRTPFQILASVANPSDEDWHSGESDDLNLWHEWELASQGRRQLTWSRGLRRLYDLDENAETDEEVVEQTDHGTEEVGTTQEQEEIDIVDSIDQGTGEIAGIPSEEWITQRVGYRQNLQETIRRICESAESYRDMTASLRNLSKLEDVQILAGKEWSDYLLSGRITPPPRRRYRSRHSTKRWSRRTPEYHRKIIDKMRNWDIRTVHSV